jgi:hypothetical protein
VIECVPDFNNDGFVNVLDVVGFINTWNAQGPGRTSTTMATSTSSMW